LARTVHISSEVDMRHLLRFWVFSLLLLAGVSFAPHARAELRVVTTTPDLAAITQALAAGRAKVTSLALPSQDPHFVDARPHLALELSKADLLILVGADLELGWLPTLVTGSRNGKIQGGAKGYLDASTLVDLLEVPVGKVDRSQGDIHPQGSPHYLLDPRRAEKVAVGIGKKLSELDPAGHDAYLAATKAFVTALRSERAAIEKKLERLRGRPIVGYHRSLAYLADWLGLVVIDHLEPKPGIPPNPRHVAQVVELARARKVACLLQESWWPTSTSAPAAEKIGVPLVVIPGMTNFPAGQTYTGFLGAVAAKLEKVP
jgi:zinc/manganese transport system substrate-binding protein